MQETHRPEVIVIGAGLGGLAAACDLVRSGVDVLVLERHSLPGGFATSFVRGRFEFESSLHEVSDSPAIEFVNELVPGLEFIKIPEAYRLLLTDDGVDFTAPFGTEAFIKAIVDAVPGSEKAVKDFMSACAETFEALAYLGETPRPSPRKLFREYGNVLRTGAATLDEVADAVSLPQKARDLIFPYWVYIGVSSPRVSFSLWASMVHSYLMYGAVIPKTRSHGISAAMADYIRKNGGRIRYKAEVKRIKSKKRQITEVVLSDGETIPCDSVISNVSPHRVFGGFSEKIRLPRRAIRATNVQTPGMSCFVLYLGLDKDRESLGLNDYSYFIAPHMDSLELENKFMNRHDPEPIQATVCLNVADPDASPPGTCILSITIGTRPEAWTDVTPRTYHREKRRFAELAITQFEKATGIRVKEHIEEIEMAAPPTFARYVGSWDGTVYGYEPVPWDGIIPRVLSRGKERIFRNLHFCGGNSFRAFGYASAIMSGRTAAELTLAERN